MQLAVALEHAGIGTFAYDPNTDAWFTSPANTRLHGSDDAAAIDSPAIAWFKRCIHPEDWPRVARLFGAIVRGDTSDLAAAYRVVGPDGETRWLRATGTAGARGPRGHAISGTTVDITEQRRVLDELDATRERYRQLVIDAPEAIILASPETRRIVEANAAACRLFGVSREKLLAAKIGDFSPEKQPDGRPSVEVAGEINARARREGTVRFDWTYRGGDGRELMCEVAVSTVEIDGETLMRGAIVDVTERRRMQAITDQRSRLESLGRLAGGVAHDFNNLLTAIQGHAGLAQRRPPGDPRLEADLHSIELAAGRAGQLTRQLLTFARQQRVRPQPIVLNDRIDDAIEMLRPLVPANVRIKVRLERELWPVSLDPSQFQQVIFNLVLNARDALPRGGRITIRTGNLSLTGEDTGYAPGVPQGEWVVLSVADNGTGMSQEVLAHVFEPFFSTKDQKGTGLGLATCHGIVQQAGGRLVAQSEAGMGSIFRVFLPRSRPRERAAPDRVRERLPATPPRGGGTVMVVEDEAMVREVAVSTLESAGYRVIEAQDAETALERSRGHSGDLDLLVTDVLMPGLSGPQLAERMVAERPGLPVLFVSGYTEVPLPDSDPATREADPNAGAFLPKPYTPEQLGRKVGELIRMRRGATTH